MSAVAKGWPRILVINRPGAAQRRDRLLEESGLAPRADEDRDEYPPAVGRGRANGNQRGLVRGINPLGWMADVMYVPDRENQSHGSSMGVNGTATPARTPPVSADALARRGNAQLQLARETADPSRYARAEAAFGQALRRDRRSVDATIGMATLALARHDFRAGLRYAQRARRLEPKLARPFSVLVDAQLELGRYEQAGHALQQMIDLQPNLASYARVSYFRELHGDLAGATRAMRLAVSAGAGAPENVAYVQTLLGDLQALRGRTSAARRAYAAALTGVKDYVPALASRAQLDAASGRLRAAIGAMRRSWRAGRCRST